MELLDRVAVVTGAGGAVGAAVARRFADEGARLVLADEDKESLDQIRQELGHAAESVGGLSVDLTSASQVDALVERAVARFGQIDILVNAMGMAEEPPWSEPGPAAWERHLRGLTACVLCCQAVARAMRGRGQGRIVNIAATAGRYRSTYFRPEGATGTGVPSAATSGGVLAVTRQLALELGPRWHQRQRGRAGMDPHRPFGAGLGADAGARAARHPLRDLPGPAWSAGRGGRRSPLPGVGCEQLRLGSGHRRQWRLVDVVTSPEGERRRPASTPRQERRLKLAERVTIVTGAAMGIGKAIAMACAREGGRIVLCDILAPSLAAAEAEVRGLGAPVLSVRTDVTDGAQVGAMVEEVLKMWGRVDILVNNAGGGVGPKGLSETLDADWDAVVDLNLKSQFLCCRAVAAPMRRQAWGRIINIASNAGRYRSNTGFGGLAYSAAKGGVLQLTRSVAHELGTAGSR